MSDFKKTVLIGLSGGVDSAVSVLLLKNQGYEVIGVHFHFFGKLTQIPSELKRQLNIPIIEYDARKLFRNEVITYFTQNYLQGLTPSPCAHCNPKVKCFLLQKIAGDRGIQKIATGHYIRLQEENGLHRIYKARDIKKDQSYYLWGLQENIRSAMLTPLGEYLKTDVKAMAEDFGLPYLSDKKESAGLCFAAGRSCAEMLSDFVPGVKQKITEGKVLSREGEFLGTHAGYPYYTIGQKKGMELNLSEKLCVAEIDPLRNILIVDKWENLFSREFFVHKAQFADFEEIRLSAKISVMVRGFGQNPEGFAEIKSVGDGKFRVRLENPAWAVAPGQPAVFYEGEKLLGGGIIVKSSD